MKRKKFIQTCGLACVSGSVMMTLIQSCGMTKNMTGTVNKDELLVNLSEFELIKNGQTQYRKYGVIFHDTLKFPIYLFRHSVEKYTALWMQCTHQGAELQVFGDKLQCPSHGSEFDNEGRVINSPANQNLRKFPVTIDGNTLKISLKTV